MHGADVFLLPVGEQIFIPSEQTGVGKADCSR